MPTYNRAAFLTRSVASVLRQDCVPEGAIELIVVDDGSTDGTEGALAAICSEKQLLRVLRIDHIGEPGTVRNVGMEAAEGTYVAYCDSDDMWFPHQIQYLN